MSISTLFVVLAIIIFGLVGGMLIYPVLQAFGLIACNCDRKPEDKWLADNKNSSKTQS